MAGKGRGSCSVVEESLYPPKQKREKALAEEVLNDNPEQTARTLQLTEVERSAVLMTRERACLAFKSCLAFESLCSYLRNASNVLFCRVRNSSSTPLCFMASPCQPLMHLTTRPFSLVHQTQLLQIQS